MGTNKRANLRDKFIKQNRYIYINVRFPCTLKTCLLFERCKKLFLRFGKCDVVISLNLMNETLYYKKETKNKERGGERLKTKFTQCNLYCIFVKYLYYKAKIGP